MSTPSTRPPDPRPPTEPIRRLIVGIDGSANSTAAAEFTASMAEATGARVLAVHAVGLLDRFGSNPTPAISHDHRDEIEADFRERWCRPLAGCDFDARLVDGNPSAVLLRVADTPGDVIVVGRRGAGGFAELSLGSTSSQVVHHATVPVLVIPLDPEAAETPSEAPEVAG